MSRLQRQFARSRILRRYMLDVLGMQGALTGKGYKRLWNGIIAHVFEAIPEAHIKCLLLQFLQCCDITADERTEAIKLLQMAETALTPDQTEIILEELRE